VNQVVDEYHHPAERREIENKIDMTKRPGIAMWRKSNKSRNGEIQKLQGRESALTIVGSQIGISKETAGNLPACENATRQIPQTHLDGEWRID
jgi:hypothetical protein